MLKNATLFFLMVCMVFVAGAAYGSDELSYSGSSTIGMSVLDAGAVKAFEQKTGIKFKSIEQPGSGKGIQALLDGKVTLAGASRSLKPEEKAKKLLGTAIGYDAIAVFVHKNNPVKNLTKEQVKGIFTGKIKNWKEVGGKDALIKNKRAAARPWRCTIVRRPHRVGTIRRPSWHYRSWNHSPPDKTR